MTYKEFIEENKNELIDYLNVAILDFEYCVDSFDIKQYLIKAVNDYFKENNKNLRLDTQENYLISAFRDNNSFHEIKNISFLAYKKSFCPNDYIVVTDSDCNSLICSLSYIMSVFDDEYGFIYSKSREFYYYLLVNKPNYEILFKYLTQHCVETEYKDLIERFNRFTPNKLPEELENAFYDDFDSLLSDSLTNYLSNNTVKLLFESLHDYLITKSWEGVRFGLMMNIYKEVDLDCIINSSYYNGFNMNDLFIEYYCKIGGRVYEFEYIDILFKVIKENIHEYEKYMIENYNVYKDLWEEIIDDLGKDDYFSKVLTDVINCLQSKDINKLEI